jgi:hypothetical protein
MRTPNQPADMMLLKVKLDALKLGTPHPETVGDLVEQMRSLMLHQLPLSAKLAPMRGRMILFGREVGAWQVQDGKQPFDW